MSGQSVVDDLLSGLNADDLDFDLDGEDDFEVGGAGKEDQVEIDEDVGFDDCASFLPPPDPASIPFVGFFTGRQAPIPPPSKAAVARVRKVFEEDPHLAELASASFTESEPDSKRPKLNNQSTRMTSGFATASGNAPPPISAAARSATTGLFTDSSSQSGRDAGRVSGFATAGGSAPPPISRTAAAAANSLFDPDFASPSAQTLPTRTSGFSTATGRAPPPISVNASTRGIDLFNNDTPSNVPAPRIQPSGFANTGGGAAPPVSAVALSAGRDLFGDSMDDETFFSHEEASAPSYPTGFQTAAGKVVPPPSSAARARAMTFFDDPDTPAPIVAAGTTPLARPVPTSQAGPSSQGFKPRSAVFKDDPGAFVTPRPVMQARQSTMGSTFRTPLRATTNTPLNGSPAPKYKPIEITPLRRRVGLGMTPARFGKKAGFATPFKTGLAPPRVSEAPVAGHSVAQSEPVFDMTKPPNRQTYRQAYLKPQYQSPEELAELGIPPEIMQMDLKLAKAYCFEDEGVELDTDNALSRMKGCNLATQRWVVNHWSMILWKLAGVIQAQYTLYDQLWRGGVIIDQLLYRYEREYGRAERPIIRRIFEHDSSASLPLVLCVSAIIQPVPTGEEKEELRPGLELTDGWYKISTQVDECLSRAIKKGRIRAGRKLAITGAKLESSDGVDPLEGYDKSLLSISGNSTKLARWDAKLGVQRTPYIAGLSSLSVDGGIITLLDVIVDKVFPLAYTSADRGNKDAPWDEEEERRRQDAWTEKYTSESTKLKEELQKRMEKLEDIVEALCSAAEGVEGGRGGNSPNNIEEIFDGLLETKSVDTKLRTMAGSTVLHLAEYARGQYEREAMDGYKQVEADLQVSCPERSVRDFRVVRIKDARAGYKPACRAGMLNVWEAKGLEIEVGKRYMISNIMPGRSGDWRPPQPRPDGSLAEIYLHTRKDTRWQLIE